MYNAYRHCNGRASAVQQRMKQAKTPRVLLTAALSLVFAGLPPLFAGGKVPTRVAIDGVPCVEQIKNYCGPAALTSVLKHWGLATDQKTVGKAVYDNSLQATNGADMMLYARSKGFSAYSWNSSLQDLKQKLALGIPVIVLQDSSPTDRSGHYRVAAGYDDDSRVVFVNDPYEPEANQLGYDKFQSLWERHGNWSLLICPKDRDTFKAELNDSNPVVHIDLAYVYFKHGDLKASERESRIALDLEPQNYSAKALLAKATRALGARSNGEAKAGTGK